MGYWVTIWVLITLQEQLIFRWKFGYIWEDWNDRKKLPPGLAALATSVIDWAGAVLGIDQIYFVAPSPS